MQNVTSECQHHACEAEQLHAALDVFADMLGRSDLLRFVEPKDKQEMMPGLSSRTFRATLPSPPHACFQDMHDLTLQTLHSHVFFVVTKFSSA